MLNAVYNSAIPQTSLKFVKRASRFPSYLRLPQIIVLFALIAPAFAGDWSSAEQQLAQKIAAITGPGAINLTIQNRSSLGRRDSDVIQDGLRLALQDRGLHFASSDQSAAAIAISLSENPSSYVWVAEIRQGTAEPAVVMVSVPRPPGTNGNYDSMPLSLRKNLLLEQPDQILDAAILEDGAGPKRIAVLGAEKVFLYRMQGTKWQEEQTLAIEHTKPWPRDLRGRLILAEDHLFDAYLPGEVCRSSPAGSPLMLTCRESDDPWPLVPKGIAGSSPFPSTGTGLRSSASIPQMAAFFAPTRNFFTGAMTSAIGKFNAAPKFYSVALLPREKYTLWMFAATDGTVHMVDGVSDQVARLGWGSDIVSVKTSCGAGWQVLATNSDEKAGDTVRAFEFPDRDPVAVSTEINFPGPVKALWSEATGSSAIAVAKNLETGNYEAYELAVACGQ